jgi:hypothetical protein
VCVCVCVFLCVCESVHTHTHTQIKDCNVKGWATHQQHVSDPVREVPGDGGRGRDAVHRLRRQHLIWDRDMLDAVGDATRDAVRDAVGDAVDRLRSQHFMRI